MSIKHNFFDKSLKAFKLSNKMPNGKKDDLILSSIIVIKYTHLPLQSYNETNKAAKRK